MNTGEFQQYVVTMKKLLAELSHESDRAAVIVGAAFIDSLLRERICSRLLPAESGTEDTLFDPTRPLGSFGSRIDLAYRMRIISSEFARALKRLAKLRNQCAHVHDRVELDQQPFGDLVRAIVAPFRTSESMWNDVLRMTSAKPGARGDIGGAVFLMASVMQLEHLVGNDAEPFATTLGRVEQGLAAASRHLKDEAAGPQSEGAPRRRRGRGRQRRMGQ